MNKIIVLVVGLIAISLSMNTFAYNGHDFKILDETIQSSPGFNFGVEENHAGKKIIPKYASSLTMTSDKQGHIKEHIQIDGYHNINISNYNSKAQLYEYTYILYCENSFGKYVRHIEVGPGGSFSTNDHSYGDVQKNVAGFFKINASTRVSGESNAYHEAQATLRILK